MKKIQVLALKHQSENNTFWVLLRWFPWFEILSLTTITGTLSNPRGQLLFTLLSFPPQPVPGFLLKVLMRTCVTVEIRTQMCPSYLNCMPHVSSLHCLLFWARNGAQVRSPDLDSRRSRSWAISLKTRGCARQIGGSLCLLWLAPWWRLSGL